MKDDVSNRSYYFNLNKIFSITIDYVTTDAVEMKLEEETLNG